MEIDRLALNGQASVQITDFPADPGGRRCGGGSDHCPVNACRSLVVDNGTGAVVEPPVTRQIGFAASQLLTHIRPNLFRCAGDIPKPDISDLPR